MCTGLGLGLGLYLFIYLFYFTHFQSYLTPGCSAEGNRLWAQTWIRNNNKKKCYWSLLDVSITHTVRRDADEFHSHVTKRLWVTPPLSLHPVRLRRNHFHGDHGGVALSRYNKLISIYFLSVMKNRVVCPEWEKRRHITMPSKPHFRSHVYTNKGNWVSLVPIGPSRLLTSRYATNNYFHTIYISGPFFFTMNSWM